MTSSSLRSGNCSDDYQAEAGILELETIEDRLSDAFDNLTAKSSKTRLVAYETIKKTLSQRYMIEFIFNRKITILESTNRCLKRSKGQDLGHAATLISIICITIGPDPETDPILSEFITQLLVLLEDQTIQAEVRSSCARAVGVCTFIIGIDGYIEKVMDRLFAIFSASCAKGDGTMPNPSEQIAALHTACLQAWALLLTAINSTSAQLALDLVEEHMDKIVELLDSPHLEVRLASGEILAIMQEIIKLNNDDVRADDFDDLCDKLRELMTDTQKSKGKKDLRQQRANFREILAAFEGDELPNLTVKFGGERLVLDSWSRRRQYNSFCELLGTGVNFHLAENEVLRDIFSLGAVISHLDLPRVKSSDKSYGMMVINKNRSKQMRSLRDKRADLID